MPLVDVGPAGEDRGRGGKYLLLPPDFKGNAAAGYIVVRSQTHNGYALFRAIPKTSSDEDVAGAIALVKQLRLYPLSNADGPPEQRFIDMAGRMFDGIVGMDESFYANLAKMVNEEPILAQDRTLMGMLRELGLEKGKSFDPDAAAQAGLKNGIREADAWLTDRLLTYGTSYWPDSRWQIPVLPVAVETAFSFERPSYLDVDARGIGYFSYYAPPKKLGEATFYLGTFKDAKGDLLRATTITSCTSRLTCPPSSSGL